MAVLAAPLLICGGPAAGLGQSGALSQPVNDPRIVEAVEPVSRNKIFVSSKDSLSRQGAVVQKEGRAARFYSSIRRYLGASLILALVLYFAEGGRPLARLRSRGFDWSPRATAGSDRRPSFHQSAPQGRAESGSSEEEESGEDESEEEDSEEDQSSLSEQDFAAADARIHPTSRPSTSSEALSFASLPTSVSAASMSPVSRVLRRLTGSSERSASVPIPFSSFKAAAPLASRILNTPARHPPVSSLPAPVAASDRGVSPKLPGDWPSSSDSDNSGGAETGREGAASSAPSSVSDAPEEELLVLADPKEEDPNSEGLPNASIGEDDVFLEGAVPSPSSFWGPSSLPPWERVSEYGWIRRYPKGGGNTKRPSAPEDGGR